MLFLLSSQTHTLTVLLSAFWWLLNSSMCMEMRQEVVVSPSVTVVVAEVIGNALAGFQLQEVVRSFL